MAGTSWRKEETILALDLYLRCSQHRRKPTSEEITRHLELLSQLGLPLRSYASINMKMGNFAALDPENLIKGLDNPSSQDRIMWREFANSAGKLRQEAARIKRGTE